MNSEEVEEPHYLNVMWTAPYDLNIKYAYHAVGISHATLNTTAAAAAAAEIEEDDSTASKELYNQLYYNTAGPFRRAPAGQMAEYVSESDISKSK